ncbi:hypothetical protein [Bacillus cereus]|uniref:hypothetical protein n=1 Tax=Bacillus cereus TaxID=1396 RepID=UPI00211D4154|nr:hypothetical protein [Bacillus cereus]
MSIDLALKDLIPFGSTLLGAITGGVITYSLFTVKERKGLRNSWNLCLNYRE